MYHRIREIRKHLDLSQREFGEKLGVSRDVMANIENNRVEPSELFVNYLCSTFNVSESWLRTGEGDMFVHPDTFTLDEYARENELSALEIKLFKAYLEIPHEMRATLLDRLKETFCADCKFRVEDSREREIDREVSSYRSELEDEKGDTVKSSALPNAKEA
ncbi:MAG: helix-turn-helix transcriptional regulator [Intestinimonas sp.]|nr:helix-turn-helix transcriptional regulator [Intestinimonas sp.]